MFTRLDKQTPKAASVRAVFELFNKLHPEHNLDLAFSFQFYLIWLFHMFGQSQLLNKTLQRDCYQRILVLSIQPALFYCRDDYNGKCNIYRKIEGH